MVQICQTIRYCTSRNCRNSSRVDCLSICVYPQLKILSQVLHKIREKASVLLIAPYWPNGPWFPNLLEILTAPLWLIPLRQDPLFLCFGGSTKGQPVSKQRLSHWVVDTIALAYSSLGMECPIRCQSPFNEGDCLLVGVD